MATLNLPQNGKVVKGRTRKPIPGVDLTAMVDLAFLLITFFMLTTSLSKMNAMEIAKPIESNTPIELAESRTMTILLGKNNQVAYYMGEIGKTEMKISSLPGIQKKILQNKELVAQKHHNDPSKYMVVVIKPTDVSNYKNFVDVIDEMHITAVKSYFIDDKNIAAPEKEFMQSKGVL
jgi:biopolymer transport protein ExbD